MTLEPHLVDALGLDFDPEERNLGATFIQEGKADLTENRPDFAEASIRHFKVIYWVWVKRQGDTLSHDCDCPHFEETGKGCEHLFALKILLEPESETAEEIEAESDDALLLRWRLLPSASLRKNRMVLDLRDESGRPVRLDQEAWARVEDDADIRAVRILADCVGGFREARRGGGLVHSQGPFEVAAENASRLLLAAAATTRLEVADEYDHETKIVSALPGAELELFAEVQFGDTATLRGHLALNGDFRDFGAVQALVPGPRPWVVVGNRLHPIQARGAGAWARTFKKENGIELPTDRMLPFLAEVAKTQALPRFLKDGSAVPLLRARPRAELQIDKTAGIVQARLSFFYREFEVPAANPGELHLAPDFQHQILRDRRREAELLQTLLGVGFEAAGEDAALFFLPANDLIAALEALVNSDIELRSNRSLLRPASLSRFKIEAGRDWFELQGRASFSDSRTGIPLAQLLRSYRSDSALVVLDDETVAVLSAADRQRLDDLAILAAMGEENDRGLRFANEQALLADLILSKEKQLDRTALAASRQEIEAKLKLTAAEPSPRFCGSLRPYQKTGLAWLEFVKETGLGACLADEMGLGKTVQVIAFADKQLHLNPNFGPILVVTPLSLLANWEAEFEKFAPNFSRAVHMGSQRDLSRSLTADVVFTSYGTLRRDSAALSQIPFDLVVLDEAQAIKNRDSQTSAAARQLNAKFRIAMTGTPVENRLEELWSLFEFLSPALFLPGRALDGVKRLGRDAKPEDLMRALRPIMLRRRKEEVLDDLPELVEQTILCAMTPKQEALYGELLTAARQGLKSVEAGSGSHAQVLQTLLRLRQIACHPRLVAAESPARSGKVELLIERLIEAQAEGRKALVFSQFTSLLDLVAEVLEAAGITSLRLDGRVRNRDEVCRRFQDDPAPLPLLVSLKVGGTGLNLTAAEEVFILDPWWNPAVESQAIARAHRIGQTKRVHAMRLVSRGTVEEGILKLQDQKRELATAILGEAVEGMAGMKASDLELLLSN